MADRAKHAFGKLEDVQKALDSGKIDSFDILFLDGDTDPKLGWIDSKGNFRLVKNETDLSGIEAELAKKANAKEVDAKIAAALDEHMEKMYEIASVPEGALIDYRDKEIRVMCPANSVWTKQSVGVGGDPNCYYCTFKTYAPDNAVGYIEHLNGMVDSEILADLKTDEHGRRYQPTWLALARYDEASDTWTYYGKDSTVDKYIGYDYQIDWYNADGVMIASDCIRINLSNEECHSEIKPYYWNELNAKINAEISEKINEIENKIEEVSCEVVEF